MPTIKGTASVSDDHAMAKLLKKTNFPANYSTDINLSKINIPVMSQWIERKITELLGFDDEIVASTAINLFLPTTNPAFDAPVVPPRVDPKRAQLNLAGFLGEEDAATFCRDLWTLLVDAQTSPTGIPRKLLEETKHEMASRRPRNKPTVMNPMVQEASRRAEAARQALAAAPPRAAASRDPVPVSPPHPSEQPLTPIVARRPSPARDRAQRKRDDESPQQERKNPPPRRELHRERHSRRKDDGSYESPSSSSSLASSFDSEEERRRRRRDRERQRRYEVDEDRRGRVSRDHRGEDQYGRRRRQYEEVDRRPRYRDEERGRGSGSSGRGRDRHSRDHRDRSRSRSRSYERADRRRRHRHSSSQGRRSRSYSDSS